MHTRISRAGSQSARDVSAGPACSDLRPADFALGYASLGYPVMPLARGSNRPHPMLGKGWTFEGVGTSDPAGVRTWWSWDPAANIGVVTGVQSGLLVLDCDIDPSDHGYDHLSRWAGEHGLDLEHLPTVNSPSGGLHVWLGLPAGVGRLRSVTRWLTNVDALADGHMVAVPPSCRVRTEAAEMGIEWREAARKGLLREYDWRTCPPPRDDLPMAPDELIDSIRHDKAGFDRRPTVPGGADEHHPHEGSGLPPTEVLVEHGLPPGCRDDWCWALACRLWWRYGDRERVTAVMYEVWEKTPVHVAGDRAAFTWEVVAQKIDRAERQFRAEFKEVIR